MRIEGAENISYYAEMLPSLVERLETMVENNLEIVSKQISFALSDSKLKSALESRRLAVEDAIWASKEIDKVNMMIEGLTESQEAEFFDRSYWRSMLPRLIKELKGMVENNMEIIGRPLQHLSDDKLKQGLVSRRISAEDSVWASKKVDELEKILTGKNKATVREDLTLSWAKRKAVQE